MAPTKPTSSSVASSSNSRKTKSARVLKEDLLWNGLIRKDELEQLATEFSGSGDFVVCPGYKGPFGSAADQWGRLYMPGAAAGYRVARATLSKWRDKTTDEKYSWWPEAMEKRGVDSVKASDIIKGLPMATWLKYVDVYHKASKVRVGTRTRERRIREVALEREDDADAAGALMSLGDAARSSSSKSPPALVEDAPYASCAGRSKAAASPSPDS